MQVTTTYLIVGFILGIFLCTLFPKIPIRLREFYKQYKEQKEKKNVTKNL